MQRFCGYGVRVLLRLLRHGLHPAMAELRAPSGPQQAVAGLLGLAAAHARCCQAATARCCATSSRQVWLLCLVCGEFGTVVIVIGGLKSVVVQRRRRAPRAMAMPQPTDVETTSFLIGSVVTGALSFAVFRAVIYFRMQVRSHEFHLDYSKCHVFFALVAMPEVPGKNRKSN